MKFACVATTLLFAGSAAEAVSTTPAPAPPALKYKSGPVDAGMSNTSSKRLSVVVKSLNEIMTSVQEKEKTEASNYKLFVQWCDKEIEEGSNSIVDAQEDLVQEQVKIKQAAASSAALKHELSENQQEQEDVKASLDQAANLRHEDQEQYDDDKTTNQQSLKQIDTAISIVGKVHKEGGFLQAGHVTHMRLNEPGESKYVLGIMKGLKEKLETSRQGMDSAEAKKVTQYNEFARTKQAQAGSLQKDAAEKKVDLLEKRTDIAKSTNEAADISGDVKTDSKNLARTTAQCHEKKREWVVKSEDRQSEKEALKEAIRYVSVTQQEESKPIKLVQVDYEQRDLSVDLEGDDNEEALIQVNRRHLHRRIRRRAAPPAAPSSLLAGALVAAVDARLTALIGVNSHDGKEGFDGAMKVVRDLIAVLQKQQVDEDEKKTYCKKEISITEDEKSDSQDKIDTLSATIQKKQSDVEVLESEIGKLKATNKEAMINDKEAAELRSNEETAYTAASKDRKLAVKVLYQAKAVLTKFYESKAAALVQSRHQTKLDGRQPKTWTDGAPERHSVESAGALAMLMEVAEDMEKEQRDASTAEKTSEVSYRQYVSQSKSAFHDRSKETTMHVMQRSRDLVKLASDKEDSVSEKKDLESTVKQLNALHDQCDDLLENHEQRLKERNFEIAQLRDVVDILSGSSTAARTGLLQKPTSVPVAKPEEEKTEDVELESLRVMSGTISQLQIKASALVGQ